MAAVAVFPPVGLVAVSVLVSAGLSPFAPGVVAVGPELGGGVGFGSGLLCPQPSRTRPRIAGRNVRGVRRNIGFLLFRNVRERIATRDPGARALDL